MTRPQLTATAGLLLLAMLMTVLIGVFDARRRVVAVEGNDLRSGQSAWVDATLAELLHARDAFAPGTKVFVTLEHGVRAVVVLSGRWVDVPLHDGRALSEAPGEALAGADADVHDDEVVVGGKPYEVVGRLGVRADSLLADDVVVSDPSQFSTSTQRLLLDGRDSARHYNAAFPGRNVEIINEGTNRRTNVDTVSPVLVALGALVATLVAVIAGVQGGRWELRAATVQFTIGVRRRDSLRTALTRFAVISITDGAVALVCGARAQRLLTIDVAGVIAPVGVVMVVAGVVSFCHGSRRWNC